MRILPTSQTVAPQRDNRQGDGVAVAINPRYLYHLNRDQTAIVQVPCTAERAKGENFYESRREAFEMLKKVTEARLHRDSIILMTALKELA